MYAFEQAMRALRSNWIASVATITTMTLSLTILAGFSLASLNLNAMLDTLQNELEMAVYLDDNANAAGLMGTIDGWAEVASVRFVPKEQALADTVADLPLLGEAAEQVDNPLPNTIELRLVDPALTGVVRGRIATLPGVLDVADGGDEVDIFLAINDALRVGGSILIVVLLSSAMFAIVNSIRAAITARSDEIEVMRLVGATRAFIRAPFLIEGFLLGLFSAAVTLLLVVPGYEFVVRRLDDRLPFVPFVTEVTQLAQLVGLLSALALLVGLIGSAISVTQYLREQA